MKTIVLLCKRCHGTMQKNWNFCPVCGCNNMSPQNVNESDLVKKALENKIKSLQIMLFSLHDAALDIMSRLDYEGLLKAILKRAVNLSGLQDGYIYTVNEEETLMTLEIGVGLYEKNKGLEVARGRGFCWHVWEQSRTVTLENYSQWPGRLELFEGLRAVIGIPLKFSDKVTGIITMSTLDPDRLFSDDEVEVLSNFATLAAIALENAKMFTAIEQEIAEHKKTQAAMLEAKAAVARSEKLASLGTMAAGVAHQISQPLNAIKMSVTGILYWYKQRKHRPVEDIITEIEEISSMTNRIVRIIERIRALARSGEPQNFGACDLNQIVEQSLDFMANKFLARKIETLWQPQKNLPSVWGSSAYIEEAVINLLANAMQALDLVGHEKKITLATRYDNEIILEISDNGPGINPEIKEKIFEPFFTTKISRKNMGFGLSIANSIITSCNGKIKIVSTGEEGTTFLLEFPRFNSGNCD